MTILPSLTCPATGSSRGLLGRVEMSCQINMTLMSIAPCPVVRVARSAW